MSRLFSAISPCWLWALLALPAAGMIAEVAESPSPRVFHELLHPTGEFAARFMIIALMATPLVMILKKWRGPRWLKARTGDISEWPPLVMRSRTRFSTWWTPRRLQGSSGRRCDWTSGQDGLPSSSSSPWRQPRWTTAFASWVHFGQHPAEAADRILAVGASSIAGWSGPGRRRARKHLGRALGPRPRLQLKPQHSVASLPAAVR